MNNFTVSIVKYEKPIESVKKTVDLTLGFKNLKASSKVFIKPNICFWRKDSVFPKWGVITTTRVVEDVIILLKEHGVDDITIGEGIVLPKPNDVDTPADAFQKLGYNTLKLSLIHISEPTRPY